MKSMKNGLRRSFYIGIMVLISILIGLLITFSISSAETKDPPIEVSMESTLNASGNLEVNLSLDNNAGIGEFWLGVEYDDSVFDLLEVQDTNLFGEDSPVEYIQDPSKGSPIYLKWVCKDSVISNATERGQFPMQTGNFAKIVFKIKPDANQGSYSFDYIDCSAGYTLKEDGTLIEHEVGVETSSCNFELSGRSVSGTATFRNSNEDVKYLLYNEELTDKEISDDIKLAEPQKSLAYQANKSEVITGDDGKTYSQNFSFTGVLPGRYKLAVYKAGGYVIDVRTMTVDTSNITEDLMLWLIGDVNGDGKVNIKDVTRLRQYIKRPGTYALSDDAKRASNVNGDSLVNIKDVTRIRQYIKTPGTYPLTN